MPEKCFSETESIMTRYKDLSAFSPLLLKTIRFMTGFIFLPHALAKLNGWSGSVAYFTKAGFYPPELFVGLATGIEFVAGISLMFGIMTKYTSILATGLLAAATYTVLTTNNPASWWLWNMGGVEYNVFWMLLCALFFADTWCKDPGFFGIGKTLTPYSRDA